MRVSFALSVWCSGGRGYDLLRRLLTSVVDIVVDLEVLRVDEEWRVMLPGWCYIVIIVE